MRRLVEERQPGILTYGMTPPKASWSQEKVEQVARAQAERIAHLPVDALVLYDLQDESERTDAPRPFPFMQCVSPVTYALEHLADLAVPKIVYRCVAQLREDELSRDLERLEAAGQQAVLVGAASRRQRASLRLSDAYAMASRRCPSLPIGGVLIAERHEQTRQEHERTFRKMDAGCRFFVTQAVYSVDASKNLLSDLSYAAEARGVSMPPVLMTLSPCGSLRTLEFMQWLGVRFPHWLENDLRHAKDILQASVENCLFVFDELWRFARAHQIPLGCNIESVSLARTEIDASVELVRAVAARLGRPQRSTPQEESRP